MGRIWAESISDAIRDRGIVNADAGLYWRARWVDGLSDEQIKKVYADAFAEFEKNSQYRFFPEYILTKIGSGLVAPYPSSVELDRYVLNQAYAQAILRNVDTALGIVDSKDLEGD